MALWSAAKRVTVAVAVVGTLGSAGCLGTCTEADCSAGFEVVITGRPPDPGAIPPFEDSQLRAAVYRVEAAVDGGTLEVECTFDDEGEGTCAEAVWLTSPVRSLDALVSVASYDGEGELWGQGIRIHFVGSSAARWGSNAYGPDMVDVTVLRDGEEAASASYAPEYLRHEDFNGEGCGDCASAPAERLLVDPA
jgi:hypothetical protein